MLNISSAKKLCCIGVLLVNVLTRGGASPPPVSLWGGNDVEEETGYI